MDKTIGKALNDHEKFLEHLQGWTTAATYFIVNRTVPFDSRLRANMIRTVNHYAENCLIDDFHEDIQTLVELIGNPVTARDDLYRGIHVGYRKLHEASEPLCRQIDRRFSPMLMAPERLSERAQYYLIDHGCPERIAGYLCGFVDTISYELEDFDQLMNEKNPPIDLDEPSNIREYLNLYRESIIQNNGYPDDARSLKMIKELLAAIADRNIPVLNSRITKHNPVACRIFSAETGLALPSTAQGIKNILDHFIGTEKLEEYHTGLKTEAEEKTQRKEQAKQAAMYDALEGAEENKKILLQYLNTLKGLAKGRTTKYFSSGREVRYRGDDNQCHEVPVLDYLMMTAGETTRIVKDTSYDTGKNIYVCHLSSDSSIRQFNQTEGEFVKYVLEQSARFVKKKTDDIQRKQKA